MAGAWPRCSKRAREVSPESRDISYLLPLWEKVPERSGGAPPSPTRGEGRSGLSLLLDAAGFHELRPLLFVLVDEAGIIFRRTGCDFGAVIAELLLHLLGGERVAQRLVELVDDRPRRA